MMLRSTRTLRSGNTAETLTLLGAPAEPNSRPARFGRDAEAMLNSRSGRIYLFPVMPRTNDVAFRNFQARGGFLISAAQSAEGTYYVEIQSRRDNTCRLMNPWPGQRAIVKEIGTTEPLPLKLDKSNGECLVFSTLAGRKYLVEQ